MKLSFALAAAAAAVMPISLASIASAGETVQVYKDANCGCCGGWIEHMRSAGYDVEATDLNYEALAAKKAEAGIDDAHASCHTAFVGGYVVEGHVPAADVRRLLSERPEAVGLTAPGMPVASPGMDMGNEPYDVLLIRDDGTAEVFARHRPAPSAKLAPAIARAPARLTRSGPSPS